MVHQGGALLPGIRRIGNGVKEGSGLINDVDTQPCQPVKFRPPIGRRSEENRALRRTLWEAASGIPPGDLRGMIHMAPDLDHTPDDMIAAMEGGDT
jgi:hypothetical protein